MNLEKSKFLKVLFLLLFSNFCFSQTKITGIIVDGLNKPIENVNVVIKNEEGKTIDGDITDNLGFFSINTKVNKIKIQVFQFNNIFYEKNIEIFKDTDLGKIKINTSQVLQEVVLVSKNVNVKKELGKYVVDNIANSIFSKGKNVFEAIKYIPVLNETESGISIFNKGEATILINGKNMGDNETALNMIKNIPAENIKKIEIIAKPDSKYEANTKNGIINIILKKNENEGLKGSVNASMNQSYFNSQYGNVFISYSKKNLNLTTGLNLSNSNFFIRNNNIYNNLITNQQTNIALSTKNNDKRFSNFINADYKINQKNTIGVQFNYRITYRNSNTDIVNIFKNNNLPQIIETSINNNHSNTPNNNSYRANINYAHLLDSIGSKIDFDNTFVTIRENQKNYFEFINSNNTIEKFNQNPDEKFNINATKIDVTKVFNDENKLYFGGNYIFSNVKNYFFHGIFDGLNYISDPLQTNNFSYRDKTYAGYINYERIINEKWEGKIGLRLEKFTANGKSETNEKETNIDNTYIFPSFTLLYIPTDKHEISFDFTTHIHRSGYSQLNPFIRFNSTNSYTINNPNLLPTLSYEFAIEYSYDSKFFVNLEYTDDRNMFNEFDIVLPNNFIQRTTANYGNSNYYNINLIYSNKFFKKNWKFTSSFDFAYNETKGYFNNYDMSFNNSSYDFKLKNQINLSKNKDFNMSFIYGYSSNDRSILGTMNSLHSLKIEFTKTYKNYNFSLYAYDLLRTDLEFTENKLEYSFFKKNDYFRNINISIRYNFGNEKVNIIEEKNTEINNRLL